MTQRIRILIADDHAIVREGVRRILSAEPDMEVVGEAGDGLAVLPLALELRPDVVVLDISMPGISGLELVPEIRRALPETQVAVLSMHQKELFVQQALDAGALGYVLKTSAGGDLLCAIRAVHQGQYFLSSKVQAEVIGSYLRKPSAAKPVPLSERETQVLHMVARGMTTKEVAARLYLSARTVEKYRASVMQKLNLRNLNELIHYAIQEGLVELNLPED